MEPVSPTLSVRRVLTDPCTPKRPGSAVNRDDDLIVFQGDLLDTSSSGVQYRVTGSLGSGTFGQVFECAVLEDVGGVHSDTGGRAAVKIIKNQAAYYHQARVEIGILQLLNTQVDPQDCYHIVRLKDFFMFKGHLCLVFELLGLNLYDLIRRNKFRGLSLSLVRVFITHILKSMSVLKDASIIHCDIKPVRCPGAPQSLTVPLTYPHPCFLLQENILLQDPKTGRVKLIDFGSACFKRKAVYTYIQSRFYRSPEVVVGYGYTEAVDMWSLGCVAAELFLGLPLFPAASEFDLIERITETIGPLPRSMLINSRNTSMYYTFEDSDVHRNPRLLNMEEFQSINMKKAAKGKQYFKHTLLRDIILNAPFKSDLGEAEKTAQVAQRECFLDFLDGLLQVEPSCRMTPNEALAHPYITGESLRPRRDDTVAPPVSVPRSSVQGIPVPQSKFGTKARGAGMGAHGALASGFAPGRDMASGSYTGTSYTPAGSIQRIQSGTTLAMSGSLPDETPPSRSLGARMHAAPAITAPLPSPTDDARVMPIMSIPGCSDRPEILSSSMPGMSGFAPSSVRTYRSFLDSNNLKTEHTGGGSLRRGDSIMEHDDEHQNNSSNTSNTSTRSASRGDDGEGDGTGEDDIFGQSPSTLVQDGMAGLRIG